MSATGRNLPGRERRAGDCYDTPAWCVRAILPHLKSLGKVLDPCCGTGAILDAVSAVPGATTVGIEIDAVRAAACRQRHTTHCRDALGGSWDTLWPWANTLITNPPYSLAMQFIERWQSEATCPVAAMLLRLNFLGSQKRARFHRLHPADVYVLTRRPSFTDVGTDSTEYAWFVWGVGRGHRWEILDCERP